MDILRLNLGSLAVAGQRWPVYGYAITHDAGVIVVDTGLGGPTSGWAQWHVLFRSLHAALADHGIQPTDVHSVINTHLHMDHCGGNTIMPTATFWLQRVELERARIESPELRDDFDFAGARLELLDGDAEIVRGVRVITTPGHTVGHQSVAVAHADGQVVLLGDAAYTHREWLDPDQRSLPPGQAADRPAWRRSIDRLQHMKLHTVYFAHDEPLPAAPVSALEAAT